MNNIKISVLMGVHNGQQHIERSLRSIINQTNQNFEFIICDDGSTDLTFNILNEYKKKYPQKIILLKNEINHGLAYSLNRCLDASSGEYIARMDVDDYCTLNRFEIQCKFLDEHPEYDLVGSSMILLDDNNKETYLTINGEGNIKDFPMYTPFAHPTVLMRRCILESLGGYSVEPITRRCEDLELWYRFFEKGYRGYNLPNYLYYKTEDLNDYKKRKIINGVEMFFVNINGLKRIHAPWYKYIFACKQIITAMIPKRLMMLYHAFKFRHKVNT